MVTLVVEDGTGVADANSYASLATIRAYADARDDHISPASDEVVTQYAIKAMDYLQGLRARYQGAKTSATQALQWPRDGVKIDCVDFANDAIPQELIDAQCALVCVQGGKVELAPVGDTAFVVEDITGPLTTKYSDKHGGGPGALPKMPAVDVLLAPLFSPCGQARALTTLRV